MSYRHLAGRLIETQRSMLGKSAIQIARSVEGLGVDDDGTVTAVSGDSRAVVETLAQRYLEMLGSAAENRLLAAAKEFEDDLVLPPSLGGPDDAAVSGDGPARESGPVGPSEADPGASESTAGALSDGGTVTVQPPSGTDDIPDGAPRPTKRRRADNALQEVASIPNPVKVDYTVASSIPEGDTDLDAVYLLPLVGDSWQTPVSVADAVADALSDATELDDAGIAAFVDVIDPDRLLATLNDASGETVSFDLEGITVTFHRTGSLAVH